MLCNQQANAVNCILFYPSDRIDGKKKDRKDLVAISYLSESELEDYEYSDVNARFKVIHLMKEAGIKGARNGRNVNDPEKYNYHSIKIEPFSREVRRSERPFYKNKESFIFDYRTEREVYSQSKPHKGYLNKINRALK